MATRALLAALALAAAFIRPPAAGAALLRWYDNGWLYRKPLTITGTTAGAQTAFPVKLAIAFVAGKMKSDFSDLRFTAADGAAPLDYWVESSTASSAATAWVKLPSIPASPAAVSIYMYYGNAAAAAAGSGAATFLLFDDFSGDALDTAKWAQQDSAGGSLGVSGGRITFSVTGGGDYIWIHSTGTYAWPAWVEAKLASFDPNGSTARLGESTKTKLRANGNYYNQYSGDAFEGNYRIVGDNSTAGWTEASVPATDTSGIWSFCWAAANSQIFNVNYAPKLTAAGSDFNIANYYLYLGIAAYAAGTASVDWVRLRKYVSPEPAAGAPGAEESGSSLGAFFGLLE